MSAGFIVDKENPLTVVRNNNFPPQPVMIRFIAKVISYIFHPVFVPIYIVIFMVYVHPWIFAGFSEVDKSRTVIMSALMYTFFPVVTVLLLKALKFINTINLVTQKDRIIPLVACGIWYFWIWYVWKNLPEYPASAIKLALAIWISASLGLMANIIMKVSFHAISMGVMLTYIFFLAFTQSLNFGIYLSVALFITGLVCSSRFISSDHEPKEIYGGLVVGVVSMLVAGWLG